MAVSRSGKKTPIWVNYVKFVPGLHFNMLRSIKAMKVFELCGKENPFKLNFNNLEYCFDHKIKSGSGVLFGLKVITGKGNRYIPYEKGNMFLTCN